MCSEHRPEARRSSGLSRRNDGAAPPHRFLRLHRAQSVSPRSFGKEDFIQLDEISVVKLALAEERLERTLLPFQGAEHPFVHVFQHSLCPHVPQSGTSSPALQVRTLCPQPAIFVDGGEISRFYNFI